MQRVNRTTPVSRTQLRQSQTNNSTSSSPTNSSGGGGKREYKSLIVRFSLFLVIAFACIYLISTRISQAKRSELLVASNSFRERWTPSWVNDKNNVENFLNFEAEDEAVEFILTTTTTTSTSSSSSSGSSNNKRNDNDDDEKQEKKLDEKSETAAQNEDHEFVRDEEQVAVEEEAKEEELQQQQQPPAEEEIENVFKSVSDSSNGGEDEGNNNSEDAEIPKEAEEEQQQLEEEEEEDAPLEDGEIEEDVASNNSTFTTQSLSPKWKPITKAQLAQFKKAGGSGSLFFAYRVVSLNGVSSRVKPCPIGDLVGKVKAPTYKIVRNFKYDEIVVGIGLTKTNLMGLWLQLGEDEFVPIQKKHEVDNLFHAVMKQIRRIPIPIKLKYYWQLRPMDCTGLVNKRFCLERNGLRKGVLDLMMAFHLIEELPNWPTLPPPEVIVKDLLGPEQGQESQSNNNNNNNSASESLENCREIKAWSKCTRFSHCLWVHQPNLEYCDYDFEMNRALPFETIPLEMKRDVLKYQAPPNLLSLKTKRKVKYFVYQPSGGWNNQRLLLENALVICRLTNRTCIAPPAAPHSNYYYNYNKIPKTGVVSMARVLNFEKLNQVVPVYSISENYTFDDWLQEEILKVRKRKRVLIINRDVSKYKAGTIKKWGEREIINLFGRSDADVIFFANQSMWGTIEWRGGLAGWPERKMVQLRTMMPNHMKKLSRRISEALAPYHAVHIRRGDKVSESNFKSVSHGPAWWAGKIAFYNSSANRVYIATDEKTREFFDVFKKQFHLEVVFWENLPLKEELIEYLSFFPKRMFMDILGMIEQLICTYAIKFLGSGYSTFSVYILRMRKYRRILGGDTDFPVESGLGLPEQARAKSTCDPITALTHSKPC